MLSHELREMIVAAGWPAESIATGAKIPLNVVQGFLEDTKFPATADYSRLQSWADTKIGVSSTGKQFFDRYRGNGGVLPTVLAPDATKLPRGPRYEESGVQDVTGLTITDEEQTIAARADYLGGVGPKAGVTGVGATIVADKVIAGKQVAKTGRGMTPEQHQAT